MAQTQRNIQNKELDSLYIYPKQELNLYSKWFDGFWKDAKSINQLDISKFSEISTYDIENDNKLQHLSEKDMKNKIDNIPDEILRNRLLLWLEYIPSNIYDGINVAEKDYIAIEYYDKSMIILEFLIPGNSYFVFYKITIYELINQISDKTKSEIFELSNMGKRGYHVREKLTLELNVKSYFINM